MRLLVSIFLFFLLVVGVFAFCLEAKEEVSTYGTVPDFIFIDQNGKQIARKNLVGNIWIADFIFTRCQNECPLISGRMAGLQKDLPSRVKFVSFSVDPAYDTPEVLSKYAARFGAEEGRWFFLTGEQLKMWDFIAEGFHLGTEKATAEDLAAGAQSIMHSNRYVLVDGNGMIRGYYDSSDPGDIDKLIRNASTLVVTPPPSNQIRPNDSGIIASAAK